MKERSRKETLKQENARLRNALNDIALLGHGIKESSIDWKAVSMNAKMLADRALNPKCPTCGKTV